MKKMMMVLCFLFSVSYFIPAQAQNISININLDRQPAWGPIGYDYVDFYYFPDINVYFDVNYGMFYYLSGRRWVASRYLPAKYGRYDLYGMYKVVINERDPWLYNKYHKRDYAYYRGNRNQVVIRNSSEPRYITSRNNHVVWVEPTVKKSSKATTTTTKKVATASGRQPASNQATSSSGRSTTTSSRKSTGTTTATNSKNSSGTTTNSRSTSTSTRTSTSSDSNTNSNSSRTINRR